jgi:hypothetical protein
VKRVDSSLLVSYVLIVIVSFALITYVVLNRLMYDVILANIISGLLAIASWIGGYRHGKT